jgi:hypothetical protein
MISHYIPWKQSVMIVLYCYTVPCYEMLSAGPGSARDADRYWANLWKVLTRHGIRSFTIPHFDQVLSQSKTATSIVPLLPSASASNQR